LGTPAALSQLACINIRMDKLTKTTIDVAATEPLRFQILGILWYYYVARHRITKQVTAHLHNDIGSITIEAHWDKENRYKAGYSSMLDYVVAGRAVCNPPKAQQWWVVKLADQFLPYGTSMKRWNLQTEDQCPCSPASGIKNPHNVLPCASNCKIMGNINTDA